MKSFATRTMIAATPAVIWDILTDAPHYPDWNTTVSGIDGAIAPGQTITVHATISPGRAFPLRIVAFDAPVRMLWSSGMPLGLFRGERSFELRPTDGGRVEFARDLDEHARVVALPPSGHGTYSPSCGTDLVSSSAVRPPWLARAASTNRSGDATSASRPR